MSRRFVVSVALVLALVAAWWFALRGGSPAAPRPSVRAEAPPPSRRESVAATVRANAVNPGVAQAAGRVPAALASELPSLLAIADPDERFRRLDEFWRRWYARDRDGSFAAIAQLPAGDERSQALTYALLEVAKAEPDRALDLALQLANDPEDASVFAALFDAFAKEDLVGARERLARVTDGAALEPAWRAFTDAFAQADLAAALAWARTLSNGATRTLAFETVSYSLAEKDPLMAFEAAMHALDGEARDRSLYQALTRIIPHDPAAAATLIAGMPSSPQRELAIAEVARAWSADAPDRAFAWASSLTPDAGAAAAPAIANIVEIWARQDRAAALTALAALPASDARTAATERLASEFALASPEAALAWAATLRDGAEQERAIGASVAVWARKDPAAAAAWTLAAGAETDRGALFGDVISHWALQDLPTATRYVEALTKPTAQRAGTVAVAPYLAQADAAAARRWARALPNADARSAALQAIEQHVGNSP